MQNRKSVHLWCFKGPLQKPDVSHLAVVDMATDKPRGFLFITRGLQSVLCMVIMCTLNRVSLVSAGLKFWFFISGSYRSLPKVYNRERVSF